MPTQSEIANHLDMSERNVREILNGLGLSSQRNSLDEIRVAYIRDMRDKAAGRGGENFAALTKARTDDAVASAQLKQLQIAEKAGQLVPMEEIEPRLTAMVTAARQELLSLPEKIAGEIRALHGIDVDALLIEQHIHDALNHLAGDLQGNDCSDVSASARNVRTAAEDIDD